jgi:short-subunit dehydrogenase
MSSRYIVTGDPVSTFQDQVVLITGAASGIGRAVALQLADEGARIAALDLVSEGLDKLAADLKGRPCGMAVADVRDAEAVRTAVTRLESELGPTDLLVAAAGIGRETPGLDFQAGEVAELLRVNLIGVTNSIAAVLPGMSQRRRGHLAVLSSLASYRGIPRMAAYCASKAGVNAVLDALRLELRPVGIAVTTICPGWIRTPMTANLTLPDGVVMMDVDAAARRIVAAVRARRAFVVFPARMAWQARLVRHLPRVLSDWLTERLVKRGLSH